MWELSDYEEVKLTQGQFQDWLKQSVAQANALNRISEAIIGLKEGRLEQKLDQLISLVEKGGNTPDLGFINAKLDLILGLLEGETQDKVNEIAAKLKTAREQLESAVDNQTKEK